MKFSILNFVDTRTPEQVERYNTIEQQRADALTEIRRSGNTFAPDYPEWRKEDLARKYAPADAYHNDDPEGDRS